MGSNIYTCSAKYKQRKLSDFKVRIRDVINITRQTHTDHGLGPRLADHLYLKI